MLSDFSCLKYYIPAPPNTAKHVSVEKENISAKWRQMRFRGEVDKHGDPTADLNM